MPIKRISQFEVKRVEVLDSEGNCDEALMGGLDSDRIRSIYRYMVISRVFDLKAFKLQRQGRLGTYAPILGQEAVQVVPPLCLEKSDWLLPTYRSSGCYFARGVPFKNILLYWGGDDRGAKIPEGQNNMVISICVGTHLTHAAGIAWGMKLRGDKSAVICYMGDGATSKGDFHEGFNFAGVFKLPVVYLCENNQWAISFPRTKQTAAQTIAQKAYGYGFDGIQVDGNDAFAVHYAIQEALKKAKTGGGPTFLECETYRQGDHTTADDASRYRTPQELEAWKNKDPIARLKKYMMRKKIWGEDEEVKLQKEAEELVEAAVEESESYPAPSPLDIFSHVSAETPWHVKEQKGELERILKDKEASKSQYVILEKEGRFP